MSWTFEATQAGYANLWKSATLKGGADAANADTFSDKIIAAEQRYRTVQNATGVPWYFIGALHMREDSCDFAGVLHNGEHIIGTGKLTTLVPAGRGPFSTWEEAAIDALKMKDMQRVQSWPAARILYQAEVYNGIGYVSRGENSPYVWAGTNQEQTGKFTSDGHFDPSANDSQLGVAAVLIRLAQKRADINADLYPATPSETPVTDPVQQPTTQLPIDPTNAAQFFAMIASVAQQLSTLNANVGLLLKAQGQTPAVPTVQPVVPAAPVTPVPAAPATTATPALQQPGVGLGILGAVLTGILQATGVVGPMTGDTATTVGQVLPIVSAGVAALGATGTWGTVLNALFTVGSKLFQPAAKS